MRKFTKFNTAWFSCVALLIFTLSACASLTIDWRDLLTVQALPEQIDIPTGDGEGLAKFTPDQSLLVNNQMVFAIPGDAVLGIAMAVGAINSTIETFSELPAMALDETLRAELEVNRDDEQWQMFLTSLESSKQQLILTPYCYLNGHPDAQLYGRLAISQRHNDGSIAFVEQLESEGQRRPLEGHDSWSKFSGQHLLNDCRQLVSEALQNLVHQNPNGE